MITFILTLLSIVSICYYFTCIVAARRFFSRPSDARRSPLPPVSIMIPLYGKDFEAYENYVSFCRQDYSDYQIVFGVNNQRDSSIPVIRKLIADFPDKDITLVIDAGVIGQNPKVNNLNNMLKMAKHDVLVLAGIITGDLIRSGKRADAHIAWRPTRSRGSTLVSPTRLADSAKLPNHS